MKYIFAEYGTFNALLFEDSFKRHVLNVLFLAFCFAVMRPEVR